jgi:hypothetical protein
MNRFLLVSALLITPLLADHGRDFILLQDATVPVLGDWITFTNFNFASQSEPDETGAEIGITTGILPRTSLTASFQYADLDGRGWAWSAAGPALQFDLTPAGSPVMMGVLVGRDFALDEGESHDHGSHEHSEPMHGEEPHDHDDEHEHDEAEAGGHEHPGIHQHGIDAFHARFVMEGTLPCGTRVVGNLIGLMPDDGDAALGYALGIRRQLSHQLGFGLEVTGDFSAHDYQEAAVGMYYSPIHPVTLKLGLGTGLNSSSPDLTVRTGAVWKF